MPGSRDSMNLPGVKYFHRDVVISDKADASGMRLMYFLPGVPLHFVKLIR